MLPKWLHYVSWTAFVVVDRELDWISYRCPEHSHFSNYIENYRSVQFNLFWYFQVTASNHVQYLWKFHFLIYIVNFHTISNNCHLKVDTTNRQLGSVIAARLETKWRWAKVKSEIKSRIKMFTKLKDRVRVYFKKQQAGRQSSQEWETELNKY